MEGNLLENRFFWTITKSDIDEFDMITTGARLEWRSGIDNV